MSVLRWIALAAAALLALFLLWPGPIASERFAPGPLDPPYPPNRLLADHCVRISEGEIPYSDKLVVDAAGRIFAGEASGRVHVLTPDGRGGYTRSTFAEPGGHPMELEFDGAGNLIVADHEGSHFSIAPDGAVTRLPTLSGFEQGTAGVAVGRDGTLYYGAHPYPLVAGDTTGFMEMLESRQASELRAWDPASGEERVLATGLFRPVGVELSADEDFVAVAEFFAYRVTRHWLTGPKAGSTDLLVENLPGVPDGLASDGKGTFYLTVPGYPPSFMAWLHERPFAKDQLAKVLPLLLRLGAAPSDVAGIVVAMDEDGRVLRTFQDPDGEVVDRVTTAELHDGALYLGSIAGDWIARCALEIEAG